MNKKILVIGHGYVGQAYASLLERKHQVLIHDPYKNRVVTLEDQRQCDLAVICVPTPQDPETGKCDTSTVESVVRDLPLEIKLVLIKSTVEPGTTEMLADKYLRSIMFSPEYIGEGGYWTPPEFPHPTDPLSHGFMTIGESQWCSRNDARNLVDIMMPIVGPSTRFRIMEATEAELVKYFENAYLALKVTFANEMRRICDASDARYHVVREGWLDDPRVGTSHSAAFAHKPGFDGKCLPKDTAALLHYAQKHAVEVPLLSSMVAANTAATLRADSKGSI